MSERSRQILNAILDRLQLTSKRISLAELAYGLVLVLGIFALSTLALVTVETAFWMQTPVRIVLFWGTTILLTVLAGYYIIFPLLKFFRVLAPPSQESLARDIGLTYPSVSDRLLSLLQLAEGKASNSSPELIDHAVQSLSETVQSVPFEQIEQFQRAKSASRLASLPLVGILVFLLVAPGSFLDASKRLLQPGTDFTPPAPFQLAVEPGSIDLVRGDSLVIVVQASGATVPQVLTLQTRIEGEDLIDEIVIQADSSNKFIHTLSNVRVSTEYRITSSQVQTGWFLARIVERPIVRSLQLTLNYPRYTRIPPQKLDPNVGDVHALAGTRVQLEVGVAGTEVMEAYSVFGDGTQDTLQVDASQATGSFLLTREGNYFIRLLNMQGIENDNPIQHTLKIIPDAAPTIVLTEPEQVSDLPENLQSTLRMRISDDFGFSRLRLHYRLSETRFGQIMADFKTIDLPLESTINLNQEVPYIWDVGESDGLDPVPGDVIEFFVQVWDNNNATGYQAARSPNFQLRLPSLAEQYENLEQQEDATQDEMEDLLRESSDLNEQFQELRDELRRKQESDWEDERQLEQIQERQEAIENRVEDMMSDFEEMVNDMSENDLANDETLEMYQELQKVMEEIQSPELMEALRDLQEAMQQLDLQQMQENLNEFEQMEQQYQDRLERTLELFKQLRVQQDLDEAAKRAEDIAKQQEQIEEETRRLAEEEGEQQEGEQQEGEQQEGEQQEGEQQEGEQQEGEQQEGEQQEGEQQEGEQQEGEQQEGEQQEGEQQEGEQQEQLAQKQELSMQEMEQLEQKLEEMLERMQDVNNAPQEQMQQLQEQTEQQQIPEQMQENAEQLRNNELNEAQQQQQNMQQQLQNMQQQLQNMQQNMQGSQMQINIAGLRRALSDVLQLSGDQETLRMALAELATDSPLLRDVAQQQVEIGENLSTVSDSLQNLARKIPQMSRAVQQHAGDALSEMTNSVEALTERIARQATGHQKSAMMHMNELALLLSDLLNQLSNQSSGSGGGMSMQQMIQQMQNAAQQQQQLNQQIQDMLNQNQGQRLSRDMQERLRQMAAQQEALRSQMKQMSRNRDLRGKLMGDLNRIARQMEESIQEMQSGRTNRRTIERQRQILTRMLDATKSLQERGKERKREGQVFDDPINRNSPETISPSEEQDQLRRALIEALESGYAPDYEELIKRYFELLQEQP